MQAIQAFAAHDGALFPTAEECQDYELSLVWRERIAEFGRSPFNPYPSGAQASMVRKIILGWERFKSGERTND